jgi:signal transduction histidine kinase
MAQVDATPPAESDRPSATEQRIALSYELLLGARLYLHTWVRLFVVFSIIGGAYVARYLVGIENLDVSALLMLAVVIGAYNAVAWFISRQFRTIEQSRTRYRMLVNVMYGTIALDYLCLTCAIWLVGGARSPFLPFYLLHVILSCILLSKRAAVMSVVTAFALLMLLVLGEWHSWLPPQLPAGAVCGTDSMDGRFALTILVVYGSLFGIITYLLIGLSSLLRKGERELQQANIELDTLSNMRRDFLHIALHDLKSPVGAISGLLGNLREGLLGDLNDKQMEWINRCHKRVEGLSEFLHDIQTLASLETDELNTQHDDIDMADLLREVVDDSRDLVELHEHELDLEFYADEHGHAMKPVRGMRRLIREAVFNYITNAVKYTPRGGRIVVRGIARGGMVRVEVQDNGPGIGAEDQQRLFGEFVRLRQSKEARKTPGTGLGLSIVARIAAAHGGRVGVESLEGKGATFYLELPTQDVCWLPGTNDSR